MVCIPEAKKSEILAYFRENFPEFAIVPDAVFYRRLNQAALYVPEFIQTHKHKRTCANICHKWAILVEILCNWVAHIFVLTDALETAQGAEVAPMEQTRVASSLSEGGLSASFETASPKSESPESIYEYLSKTAYGEQAKMLLETCLAGARGPLAV